MSINNKSGSTSNIPNGNSSPSDISSSDLSRKLMVIPIVHSEADMGSLSENLEEILDEAFGKEKREEHRKAVKEFWVNLNNLMVQLKEYVDMKNVHLYQDGMPVGGEHGKRLVKECARGGSVNHQILFNLIKEGAILEQTDDPEHLKEEYEILKAIMGAHTPAGREAKAEKYTKRLDELTKERDKYIANRIDRNLPDGALGLLFIGATHQVVEYIGLDINTYVLHDYTFDELVKWLLD